MASGDAAAAQGFTPVLATDDFRLGYQRINDVADFAATRVRFYTATSDSAMNALTGMKRGDRCFRTDTNVEYLYRTSWKPLESEYQSYANNFSQVNLAFGSVIADWRYTGGKVRVRILLQNLSGTGTGTPTWSLPVTANTGGASKPAGRARGVKANQYEFPLDIEYSDANNFKFQRHLNPSTTAGQTIIINDMTVSNPIVWQSGDFINATFEYDPA